MRTQIQSPNQNRNHKIAHRNNRNNPHPSLNRTQSLSLCQRILSAKRNQQHRLQWKKMQLVTSSPPAAAVWESSAPELLW